MILTDFIQLVQFYIPKSTLILTPVYKIIFFQYKLGISFKNLTNWQTNKSNDKDIYRLLRPDMWMCRLYWFCDENSSKLSLQIVWMQLQNVENADIKSILKMYKKLHTNET